MPEFCKATKLPYPLRHKVSQELDRLVQTGVLSPFMHSESATLIVPDIKKGAFQFAYAGILKPL